MYILVLSTGLFNHSYGQQRYELSFLDSCFRQEYRNYFRIILLNDSKSLPLWDSQNTRLKFVLCGKRIRLISKIKFVLSSFFYTLKDRPSFIICGHINLSFVCLIICRLFKLKYILLTYGTDVWVVKDKFKQKALEHALAIVVVSRYTASKIREHILEFKRVVVLPPAVDTERFAPKEKASHLLKKYNLSDNRIIITVARLDYADRDKGYDKVIACLPEVLKVIPRLKYLLIGEGNDTPRIKRLITDLGLKDYVILSGFISDEELASYYNLCDCFVMPSKQEGFGIVFLEALACGKPVIAGNRDASKEALLDGKVGILVNPDDTNEIARAIINILQENVPLQLLDKNYLRQAVVEHFDLNKFSKKVKVLFDEIISCR